jgi:hypothetical protein
VAKISVLWSDAILALVDKLAKSIFSTFCNIKEIFMKKKREIVLNGAPLLPVPGNWRNPIGLKLHTHRDW